MKGGGGGADKQLFRPKRGEWSNLVSGKREAKWRRKGRHGSLTKSSLPLSMYLGIGRAGGKMGEKEPEADAPHFTQKTF